MTLEQLEQQEIELNNLLSENRGKQKELNAIAFIEKHGFNIGDKVEFSSGKNKKTGVISRLEFFGVRTAYYIINLFNSDGRIGKREQRIWNSELSTLKHIN